ncbi:MAG: hypothetical protein WC845_04015 [Candidatus Staskawiczbacteria bacterium]|jgi:hypothetical protein
MQQFLKDLLDRIEKADLGGKTAVPKGEVGTDDKVVGILPDDLKKLWVVLNADSIDLAKQCESTHDAAWRVTAERHPSAKNRDIAQQHILAHSRHELIRSLFWHGVKAAFPQAVIGDGSIGLCKDWQVTISPPDNSQQIIPLSPLLAVALMSEILRR